MLPDAFFQPIPMAVLREYHPAIALAVMKGGRLRPNIRTLLAPFTTSTQIGQPVNASFVGSGSQGLSPTPIAVYSIFGGCAPTIDPTRPADLYAGNPLAAVSDAALQSVTGIGMQLLIEGDSQGGTNYAPCPDITPMQLAVPLLNASRGTWAFDLPDGFRGVFTLLNSNNVTVPFSAWVGFVFFVLDTTGRMIYDRCRDPQQARIEICRLDAELACLAGAPAPTASSASKGS